jgi:hypothetical protein
VVLHTFDDYKVVGNIVNTFYHVTGYMDSVPATDNPNYVPIHEKHFMLYDRRSKKLSRLMVDYARFKKDPNKTRCNVSGNPYTLGMALFSK